MKKINLRPVFLVLLLAVSIGSYVFLNTVSVDNGKVQSSEPKHFLNSEMEDSTDSSEDSNTLPDVLLVKKLIEKGKGLFPAS